MAEKLGEFDPQATYGGGARDYEAASRDYWSYVPVRSVERLELQPGERVLDVPCGTGPALVAAAHAVGPDGRVVGIDIAPEMVELSRERVASEGLESLVEVEIGDMLALDRPAEPYDGIVCAFGIFFVDDMPAAVRALLDLLRPDTGRLMVSVFGEVVFEPMLSAFIEAVAAVAPTIDVVEPWRRATDEDVLRSLFESDVSIVTDDDRLPLPSPDDWWRVVVGSGLRHTVGLLGAERAAEVRQRCDDYIRANRVTEIRNTTRYALARRLG